MTNYITKSLSDDCSRSDTMLEMYIHIPEKVQQTSKVVIICGGGGFNKVNLDHEGHQFAEWLNSLGIVGCVLNYRLPGGTDKRITEKDLRQAVRFVRNNVKEWGLDKPSVGAAGFSIGGHAVSLVATKVESDSKLDFSMLFYSVTSMQDKITHIASRNKLLGADPSEEDIYNFTALNHVSANTSPCFIMACNDDSIVSPLNSVLYYERLRKHNIPAALYIFPKGGHAWGMNKDFQYHTDMLSLLEKWIRDI